LNTRQTLLMEKTMSELKKTDCISVENALTELGITRNTLNAYMNALGIPKHKFPFDRRVYITKTDLERVRQFIAENKE
jgi:hypothetical protein